MPLLGFHKIDTERWEFANEDFLRGKKSLLKKIHRRKSYQGQNLGIHIGSSSERGAPEPEGELHRLKCEKNLLMQEVVKLQQEHLMTVQQMDVLNQRMQSVEVRQKQMVSFLAKVLKNPVFLAHLRQQKEQREIASTRARRKFLKHQCSRTESDIYVKQASVDCQQNFNDSSSSSLLLDIESGVVDHCDDNLLQDMAEKLGLDASKQQMLGTSDKVVEVTDAAYLKMKDAMGAQIDCSFDTSEYFVSFSEDITPEGEIRDSLIPATEGLSRSKRDVANFKGELPSRGNNELHQSFAEEISSEEVLPGVVTPARESIIEEADIWNAGFEVAGESLGFPHDAWDNLVLYDAQELEIRDGSSTPWDVGTSGAEECLDIGKHVSYESSFQKLESRAAVPSEDPKSMEP